MKNFKQTLRRASNESIDTKQVICNKKSQKTANPANIEKVFTAGMVDNPPK